MILVKVCLLMRFSTLKSLKQHIVCECNEEIKTLNLNQYDLYISKNMDMPYQGRKIKVLNVVSLCFNLSGILVYWYRLNFYVPLNV